MSGALRTALISGVNDRTVDFAKRLHGLKFEIWASSGTYRTLTQAGVTAHDLAEITGQASFVGGRVKTLHPAVHAGILARKGSSSDEADLAELKAVRFDLLAVELYAFSATWAANEPDDDIVEAIDIGGVALLRAAAKNYERVTTVCGRDQYDRVIDAYETGSANVRFRRQLAAEAFALTGRLDTSIMEWLAGADDLPVPAHARPLRYGENPKQPAFFVPSPGPASGLAAISSWATGAPDLSYTNFLDIDIAWELAGALETAFGRGAAVAVKHASPIGAALGDGGADLVRKARQGDKVSAFGGVLCLTRPLDLETATEIGHSFWEVIAAPEADPAAIERLTARWPRLRLVKLPGIRPSRGKWSVRSVAGGELWQRPDAIVDTVTEFQHVAGPEASAKDFEAMRLGLAVAAAARSNAVAIAKDGHVLGVGSGFPNRVEAVHRAVTLAQTSDAGLEGAALGSDAFFPFADAVETCASFGIKLVVAPVGSKRDAEVQAAAERLGVALYAAPGRHFRH